MIFVYRIEQEKKKEKPAYNAFRLPVGVGYCNVWFNLSRDQYVSKSRNKRQLQRRQSQPEDRSFTKYIGCTHVVQTDMTWTM
jgi:hypothetical protein